MASDPFHTFTSTVQSSLRSAQDLSRAHRSILGTSSSKTDTIQVQTAHDRLLDAIDALKQDVEDVRQSVLVVKRSPERFGVDPTELKQREQFLRDCEDEVEQLERDAQAGASQRRGQAHTSIDMPSNDADDDDADPQAAFEREHQQSLISHQDSILSNIGRTLTSLHSQASTMGNELNEQNELIQTFDAEVEQSSTRLGKAMDKMHTLTRQADGWTGGWTVWILVVLLFFLLLVAILI